MPDPRDARIRELHERRHALQRRERLDLPMTAGQMKELADVLGEIDELELAEDRERAGPWRRERHQKLVELAEQLRPLVPAEAMVPVDAAIAAMKTDLAGGEGGT